MYQLPIAIITFIVVIPLVEDNYQINGLFHIRSRSNNEQVRNNYKVG
jgi:hypothetical protein